MTTLSPKQRDLLRRLHAASTKPGLALFACQARTPKDDLAALVEAGLWVKISATQGKLSPEGARVVAEEAVAEAKRQIAEALISLGEVGVKPEAVVELLVVDIYGAEPVAEAEYVERGLEYAADLARAFVEAMSPLDLDLLASLAKAAQHPGVLWRLSNNNREEVARLKKAGLWEGDDFKGQLTDEGSSRLEALRGDTEPALVF